MSPQRHRGHLCSLCFSGNTYSISLKASGKNDRGVVVAFDTAGPGVDGCAYLGRDSIERLCVVPNEQFGQALITELLAVTVGRFRNAVGERGQYISRLKTRNLLVVLNPGKQANGKSVAREPQNISLPHNHRSEVSCIRIEQLRRFIGIQAKEECRVFLRRAASVKVVVENGQDRRRRYYLGTAIFQLRSQCRLNMRHQERSGNSLSGNVADRQSGRRRAKRNKVIVVAADGAGGLAPAPQLKRFDLWKFFWKQLRLHITGNLEFILEPFLFLDLIDQILDASGHRIKRAAELAQLVFSFANRNAM